MRGAYAPTSAAILRAAFTASLSLGVVAISKAPSPESNPDSLLLVKTTVD